MKSSHIHSTVFLLLPMILLFFGLLFGCGNSESSKTKDTPKNDSRLIGTWQQIGIGGEKVSGVLVKIFFSEHTMTMDAPGCMIIGDYTVAGDMLTYTITRVQGEQCAQTQIGHSDTVHYALTASQLTLTPLLAGKENQAVYRRADESRQP